jgi:hypothetical protein
MPGFLFDFQIELVDWAVRTGRAAIMALPGLGKSPMGFVWGENMLRKTGRNGLIAAPCAVVHSLAREAEKFGIEVGISRDGKPHRGITLTTHGNLSKFSSQDFGWAALDEGSILKDDESVTTAVATEFMRPLPYRLLLSGLLSPNNYDELGPSSEALGYLGTVDFLNAFFRNAQNNSSTRRGYQGAANPWVLKGHARTAFYRYVCSWGRVARRPSDLGHFSDERYQLPPLLEHDHVVSPRSFAADRLFETEAFTLAEQREEARRTIHERCEKAAEILCGTKCGVGWVNLNPEGDLLTKLVPGAVQVSGRDPDERKEEVFLAFERGEISHVVTKGSIAAWGLNWQHCRDTVVFPTHSLEQYFQLVRRFWRFGQTGTVNVHRVIAEGGKRVVDNLDTKSQRADDLFDELVNHMRDAQGLTRLDSFPKPVEVPAWAA